MEQGLTREQKQDNLGYMLLLLSAAISGEQPPEPSDDIDFELIYKTAKLHETANTVFYSIEKLNKKPEPQLYKKWQDERNKGIHRTMIQSMEFEKIKKLLDDNDIDYLPIKGFSIASLYPAADYRYMSDIDFLIRKKDLKKAGALIMNAGYMPDSVGKLHHDEFHKPPFTIVELHHEMIGLSSRFYDYYIGFLDKCEKTGEHEYKMSGEDLYIFQLVHLNKHYETFGTGVRAILDMYLLNEKSLPGLDRNYLDSQLSKLELTEFFREIKEIGEKWFKRGDVSDFSKDELYILSSGAFGLDVYEMKNRRGEKGTAGFIATRLFPPVKWMQEHYSAVRKCILLLPGAYVYRFFHGLIAKRKNIKKEIRIMKKKKPS